MHECMSMPFQAIQVLYNSEPVFIFNPNFI